MQVCVAITRIKGKYDSQVGDKTFRSNLLTSEVNELSNNITKVEGFLRTSRVKEKMNAAKINALNNYP